MNIGVPDLLASSRLARDMAQVNRNLERASREVSTGLRDDPVAAAGGDPARLYALDRDLAAIDTRLTNLQLGAVRGEVIQSSLQRVQDLVSELGVELAAAAERRDIGAADRYAGTARSAFESVVNTLNSSFADRSLFAGAATDGAALADPDVILAEVAARVAAAPDAATALTAIDDYFFNDPAGFDTTGYLGSTSDAPATEIADGERIALATRADNDAIRGALAALAAAVIGAERAAPALSEVERLELLGSAASAGIAARDEVINLRATIGVAEERIETAQVRTEAEKTVLELSRNRFVLRDQFEAAAEFTALETQLQSIFTITSRLSSLSLSGFLR